jgi:hypothetical protein
MKIKYYVAILYIITQASNAIQTESCYNPEKIDVANDVVKIGAINHFFSKFTEPIKDSRLIPLTKNYSTVAQNENADVNIYSVFVKKINRGKNFCQKGVSIFITDESFTANPDFYNLTMGFDHIAHHRYIRYPLYYEYFREKVDPEYIRLGSCKDHKKYFACFLVSNGNPDNEHIDPLQRNFDGIIARDELFIKLSQYKFVASGGKHLNNIGRIVPAKETNAWLSDCKFIIAFENETKDGYTTEKVFQAYYAGGVPLYYGNKLYEKDLNPKSVIYANNFQNLDKMIEYIKNVDKNDKLYCDIWNERIITKNHISYKQLQQNLLEQYQQLIFPLLPNKRPKK